MSLELPPDTEGRDGISKCLESVRAGHDECTRFFADVFAQLDSLLAELTEEQNQWQSERTRTETDLKQQAEVFENQRAESTAQREQIDHLRRQLETLDGQRGELESELETVRTRAVEMAEELDGQKQLVAKQQDQWTKEFRSQRYLLEKLVTVLTQGQSEQRETDGAHRAGFFSSEAGGDDSVLDSVKAQFEMLQKAESEKPN